MASVMLIAHTPEPEKLVAAAAKLCYSATGVESLMDGLTPEKTADFLETLSNVGHESPLEHAVFTFALEGVSRTLLAQITRHRIASFSVQSQRYVSEKDFGRVTPPSIENNKTVRKAFEDAMKRAQEAYDEISDMLEAGYRRELADSGEETPEALRAARSRAREDARFVLPGACETKMIVTMNARSLRNFFRLRCCGRAQWEIRNVADEMLRLCRMAAPLLFSGSGPPCLNGPCPEGGMSCGRADEVRRRYKAVKGA